MFFEGFMYTKVAGCIASSRRASPGARVRQGFARSARRCAPLTRPALPAGVKRGRRARDASGGDTWLGMVPREKSSEQANSPLHLVIAAQTSVLLTVEYIYE